MHELGITESLVNIAIETGKHNNAVKVSQMRIVMGELCSYVPECIQEYFNMLAEDTIAQGCELSFRVTEARCRCTKCGAEFRPKMYSYSCPECESFKTEILEGKDLFVEDMDIET